MREKPPLDKRAESDNTFFEQRGKLIWQSASGNIKLSLDTETRFWIQVKENLNELFINDVRDLEYQILQFLKEKAP